MAKLRKTWREKLLDNKDLPKVSAINGKLSKRWGEGTCVIPAPREVDEVMKSVPKGRLMTTKELQSAIANKHQVTIACPMCCGIFAWIAAHVPVNLGGRFSRKARTPSAWSSVVTLWAWA